MKTCSRCGKLVDDGAHSCKGIHSGGEPSARLQGMLTELRELVSAALSALSRARTASANHRSIESGEASHYAQQAEEAKAALDAAIVAVCENAERPAMTVLGGMAYVEAFLKHIEPRGDPQSIPYMEVAFERHSAALRAAARTGGQPR